MGIKHQFNMEKKFLITSITSVLLLGGTIYGQNDLSNFKLRNTGLMSVAPNTIVSTGFDFINEEKSTVRTDGIIYFFKDFTNKGVFDFSSKVKTSTVYFLSKDSATKAKVLQGDEVSYFYNVVFDNPNYGIDLKNNIEVFGVADFKGGIIKVDSTFNDKKKLSYGMVTFNSGATHKNASDKSYVEGEVEKVGNESFVYPIGDKKMYRRATISAPKQLKDVIKSKYTARDKKFFEKHTAVSGVIDKINTAEYWELRTTKKGANRVVLTLSWDERITPADLLNNPEKNLHIVRWDTEQKMWIDEGGVVDMEKKEVSTLAEISGFGYFTLANVKDVLLDGDVVIYNLVTPNGDDMNDYFIIDNINKYPNNKVQIYDRWGVLVYETTNYDPKGDGSENVFNGYSEGRVTYNKNKKLPTGTYYYIVIYEYKDKNGSRMIKKAANLHLDTN